MRIIRIRGYTRRRTVVVILVIIMIIMLLYTRTHRGARKLYYCQRLVWTVPRWGYFPDLVCSRPVSGAPALSSMRVLFTCALQEIVYNIIIIYSGVVQLYAAHKTFVWVSFRRVWLAHCVVYIIWSHRRASSGPLENGLTRAEQGVSSPVVEGGEFSVKKNKYRIRNVK